MTWTIFDDRIITYLLDNKPKTVTEMSQIYEKRNTGELWNRRDISNRAKELTSKKLLNKVNGAKYKLNYSNVVLEILNYLKVKKVLRNEIDPINHIEIFEDFFKSKTCVKFLEVFYREYPEVGRSTSRLPDLFVAFLLFIPSKALDNEVEITKDKIRKALIFILPEYPTAIEDILMVYVQQIKDEKGNSIIKARDELLKIVNFEKVKENNRQNALMDRFIELADKESKKN